MEVKPLRNNVLVKPEVEKVTSSGIIMPDTMKEKSLRGEVIDVGEGTEDEKMEIKPGDFVIYGKNSGKEITIDGEEYLIMKQTDILARINKK